MIKSALSRLARLAVTKSAVGMCATLRVTLKLALHHVARFFASHDGVSHYLMYIFTIYAALMEHTHATVVGLCLAVGSLVKKNIGSVTADIGISAIFMHIRR